MSASRSREFILVLVAFAVGASGLLVAGSALADGALFRIEQRWHGFPNPAVTPGGAGLYQGYVYPYYINTPPGLYKYYPAGAKVQPGNPTGGAFTLPEGFINFEYTGTLSPRTAWPGYTTVYYYHGFNGPGIFAPNNGPTGARRYFFPTTMGNTEPNEGLGNPLTPTTTFSGRYDITRAGSIHVTPTPGGNRFGGTFRLFFAETAGWEQYIYYFSPNLYQGFGYYFCFDNNSTKGKNFSCTPDTFVSEVGTTAIYEGIWWLLTANGNDKATTPTTTNGTNKTPNSMASYLKRKQQYLNLIAPWTTGYAKAVNVVGPHQGTGTITPMGTGYDTTLPTSDITVTRYDINQMWNAQQQKVTTTTTTSKQYLNSVTRIVSMVRPRLVWTMSTTLDITKDPVENIWSPVRLRNLKVFFLPEPAGMLMLGVGIATLLGLSRMRRR